MCYAVTCKQCGKTTWSGCGQHIDSVKRAIEQAFPGKVGAANINAAVEAYTFVSSQQQAVTAA